MPGRVFGALLALVLLAPALASVPAAFLDRGPGGGVRATLFPTAMALLDPFLWSCAWNSLAVAVAVTFGSLVLGVGLARIVVSWRFGGRRLLGALVFAPLIFPPLFGALGLRIMFGPSSPWHAGWERLSADAGIDFHWGGWCAWVWVALSGGVPLVALAVGHTLSRVDPVWEDAARCEGASRRRIWRQIVWPLVRPDAARGGGRVRLDAFRTGAPLVLNLRRTLSFQIVEAAIGPDPSPRAAVLALAALAVTVVGRVLLRWWGGAESPALAETPISRPRAAHWLSATAFRLALGAGGLAWLPVLGVIGLALTPPSSDSAGGMRRPRLPS